MLITTKPQNAFRAATTHNETRRNNAINTSAKVMYFIAVHAFSEDKNLFIYRGPHFGSFTIKGYFHRMHFERGRQKSTTGKIKRSQARVPEMRTTSSASQMIQSAYFCAWEVVGNVKIK